ncbi:MAG: hypothetical protein EOL88_02310 [Bacteroidia bacterium]|nr:hypothetical protein [Bacteroidia bacterium]
MEKISGNIDASYLFDKLEQNMFHVYMERRVPTGEKMDYNVSKIIQKFYPRDFKRFTENSAKGFYNVRVLHDPMRKTIVTKVDAGYFDGLTRDEIIEYLYDNNEIVSKNISREKLISLYMRVKTEKE